MVEGHGQGMGLKGFVKGDGLLAKRSPYGRRVQEVDVWGEWVGAY